ncbi:glycosyltransferase [Mycobacterium angelicum]|uniref:Glycosyltransferase 2-like domain-containing protein n=1 Tax=Mycobacterium angelicum TaxID=470074 RepID=A0A1X0A223_MYCAN|nr:glycosyltransferase [Mycobacterium angelicum]MCV7195471.1 glycosyltransferase [Mycobacterium angelicum]ORA23776.1 hypothetical protein BST12_06320 [Mycobacterium angelicum]
MPSNAASRPAICLNMIVRNEARVVTEVLDVVGPYISSWVIVDTGSTDGTQDLIRNHMARLGIPGRLHERPWRNFGDNRTEALALAQGHGDYVWVMDADDTVLGVPDFSRLDADVYWLRCVDTTSDIFWRPLLFRDGAPVRWVGVTHEYAAWDRSCVEVKLAGDYYVQYRNIGARNASGTKHTNDRDLLLAEVERNPEDARSVFYLAQTYFCLRDFAQARQWYARRTELGGYAEEVYYSLWRIAVSMAQLGEPWPNVQDAYLRAWEFRPTRAEPLYEIARQYRIDQRYTLGHLFAERAAAIPFPDEDTLFVCGNIYAWHATDEQAVCASWIGKDTEAFALCRRLAALPDIPEDDRQRIIRNRDGCVPTMLDAALAYPATTLVQSLRDGVRRDAEVTVSVVAGPDRAGTEQTLNSFLNCCTDISRVGRFLVIDAGLSPQDRTLLGERYGFLEFADPATGVRLARIRAQIGGRCWLHLGQGWQFFAPENLISRLIGVLDAEPQTFQVGINFADATQLTGICGAEQEVRRAADAGRYVLADELARGPAMFDTARLDLAGGLDDTAADPIAELGTRAGAAGLHAASLDEVLCINALSDAAQPRPEVNTEATPYTPAFYHWQAAGSAASARVIVPMLAALTRPGSVLDVGCGVGGWVGVWLDSGADAIGVDGDYVPLDQLCVAPDRFRAHDLTTPLDLGRRFDMVTCLEVAEHLPPEAAETLVDSLCGHADTIAFSAAVPGQGGTGHLNERWPTYWAKLFAAHGYRPYDLLRSKLWWDERCEWWYRQNLLVYATDEVARERGWPETTGPLDMVHPELFTAHGGQ